MCGTPDYLAPEVYSKIGHDKTADWWSVGCLMFEMLEGSSPFKVKYENRIKIDYKQPIVFKIINDKDEIGKNAKDLILKFLVIEPEKRLGAGENGINDIKNHNFFKRIDWDLAENKKLIPPYKPDIEEIGKGKNAFEELNVNDIDENDQNYFRGFSYTAESLKNNSDLNNINNIDNDVNDNNYNNNNEKLLVKENN